MIEQYAVDFSKTFGGAMLLGVEPKMTRTNRKPEECHGASQR